METYKAIFKDLYLLFADKMPPENNEEYWTAIIEEVRRLDKKYRDKDGYLLMRGMLREIMEEIERVHKGQK